MKLFNRLSLFSFYEGGQVGDESYPYTNSSEIRGVRLQKFSKRNSNYLIGIVKRGNNGRSKDKN